MKNLDIDTAQDFMDCVAGDHGHWWQNRANQFAEDYMDVGDTQIWALWDLVRTTEKATDQP